MGVQFIPRASPCFSTLGIAVDSASLIPIGDLWTLDEAQLVTSIRVLSLIRLMLNVLHSVHINHPSAPIKQFSSTVESPRLPLAVLDAVNRYLEGNQPTPARPPSPGDLLRDCTS